MIGMLLALREVQVWGFGDWVIAVIIVAAVLGILYLALNYFEVQVPPVLWRIVGIVIVAAVAILAVRFLLSL